MFNDFVGRIGNTPLSSGQGMLPLYEAIFNSIQAIEEARLVDKGWVEIAVHRENPISLLNDIDQQKASDVTGFTITDNGIGFNQTNYTSFLTTDSRKKKNIGGKGVGRLIWLKAFEKVNINSTYKNNGGIKSRTFDFVLKDNPIENEIHKDESNDTPIETTVFLENIHEVFQSSIPKQLETIGNRIIEHFIEYFILNKTPTITIRDDFETINLTRKFEEISDNRVSSNFLIGKHKFHITHCLVVYHPNFVNKVNYCASQRVVSSKNITSKHISNLTSKISLYDGQEANHIYLGYLSSPYLENHVNEQRFDFNIPKESSIKFGDELDWSDIENTVFDTVTDFLSPYLEPNAQRKTKEINELINTDHPDFKPLLKYKQDEISKISPDLPKNKKVLELFKIKQEWECEVKEKAEEILSSSETDEEIKKNHLKFLEEFNEIGKSNLVKYIIHRKTILELLEKYMRINNDDKYGLEKTIHELIYPMRTTSEEFPSSKQNLWIIDERLTFHNYIASDKSWDEIKPLKVEGRERPDLLLFDSPIAISENEPKHGITIFEFKRPMRDDEDPIDQLSRYVRRIINRQVLDYSGRIIEVNSNTPFYCYAICDLTPKLRERFEIKGMVKTPDEDGYFDYNQNFNAYFEVISYTKLLRDSKQRNRVLFEKLNLH